MATGDDDVWNEFFGEVPADPVALRGVHLKVQPTGDLTVAHPQAQGEHIIIVQQVPATVPESEVLTRMRNVTILRRGRADFGGSQVVHYEEISNGAILR